MIFIKCFTDLVGSCYNERQRSCYTCSCGLRASSVSTDAKGNAKQETANQQRTRNCQV